MNKLASRMTYANVASTVALVAVVGGGGAAVAAGVAKNSVGSPQIKNGSVQTVDIADSTKGMALVGAVVGSQPTIDKWFNRLGGKPEAVKTGTGIYELTIPGVNPTNRIIHVTSYSDDDYCTAGAFEGDVLVSCYDPDGDAIDAAFAVTVY